MASGGAAAAQAEQPELLEDDGTLLLVRTATQNDSLIAFATALENQIPKANEAIQFAHLLTSTQGSVTFNDPSMRARFASQSRRNLAGLLEELQKEVEKTDSITASGPLAAEDRLARKSLVRLAQVAQDTLERVKEKVVALLRILGPEAANSAAPEPGPRKRRSKWGPDVEDDAPLHEKYKDVLGKQADEERAVKETVEEETADKPAWRIAEDREQEAWEKERQRKNAEREKAAATADLKPIIVKYAGRGENPGASDNLYVKGLPGFTTEKDIDAIFSEVGTIMSQKLKVAEWGAICFVRMADKAEAGAAIARFHDKIPDRLKPGGTLLEVKRPSPAAEVEKDPDEPEHRVTDKSTEAGLRVLQKLAFVPVDLTQPLGICLDDDNVAMSVVPGSQAAQRGITAGAEVRAIGGKPLTKGTEQLKKRIAKAKKRGLPQVILAYLPAPLLATFTARPFGFSVGLDDTLGLFTIGEADGASKEQGVTKGMALVSINEASLVGLTIDECFECIKQAPLPAQLLFCQVLRETAAQRREGAAVVLSSDDEGGAAEVVVESSRNGPSAELGAGKRAAAQALDVEAPTQRGEKRPKGNGVDAAVEYLPQQHWRFIEVDLEKPLGIFFDDACRAEKIGPKMQAAEFGIPKGAQVRTLAGRPLPQKTPRLVKRMKKAKAKGLTDIILGIEMPSTEGLFELHPLPFSVVFDSATRLFLVSEASPGARSRGAALGSALISLNGESVAGATEASVAQRLREAPLPVKVAFGHVAPRGVMADTSDLADAGPPLVSSSEDEDVSPVKRARADPDTAPGPQKVPRQVPASTSGVVAATPETAATPSSASAPAAVKNGTRAPACAGTPIPAELALVRVDLSQPLGIGFDNACVADKVLATAQAAKLGVPRGAVVRHLGGRSLPADTARLRKRLQKAKKKGLTEVVMGLLLPSFCVVIDERPLGFAVDQKDGEGPFLVSFARGAAECKGVQRGCILTTIEGKDVAGLTKQEVQQKLREVVLPVRLEFRSGPRAAASRSMAGIVDEDGPVVSSSGEEESTADGIGKPLATKPATPAENGNINSGAGEARSTLAGIRELESLSDIKVDMARPLGIFFDKACGAERIGDKTQAAELRVPPGARVTFAGGRRVAQTEQLVRRIQQAKKKGLAQLTLRLVMPCVHATLPERPLPFTVHLDANRGVFVVKETFEAAHGQVIEPGFLLTAVGDVELADHSEGELARLLEASPLPLRLAFRRLPSCCQPSQAELSGSDAEAEAAAA